ncbi:MAG: hypothetical protein V4510_10210 [bacterium]
MSRLLILLATAVVLFAPTATAGPTDPTVAVALANPPTEVTAQGSTGVPLTFNIGVQNIYCLPGPGHLTITLVASGSDGNATGNSTGISASISPGSVDILLPTAMQDYTTTSSATLTLSAKASGKGTVTVTPTIGALTGCTGVTPSGTGTPTSIPVVFNLSGSTMTATGADEAPVPGLDLPLLAIAVVGAVLLARRKQ